ncbi:MAG TPA: type II toxin-antitoxin system VapC family toxin [bacterium]|nr:type II toxin-antitoxin system VapC family toxin [bacterium]
MNLYAESSAVLAWLLGQPGSEAARTALAQSELVVASDLTLLECDRVLIRGQTVGEITETAAADRRAVLNAAATSWHLLRIGGEIIDRARRPFPAEPIRTLDALHLASALSARAAVPGLAVLSMDERIRKSAMNLGLQVIPAGL